MTTILYSFRRCPYAMRARMALQLSGLEYEHREVLLRNKPEAMLAASPKGTVPVFITTNGHVIDESLAIIQFALRRNDPEDWLKNLPSSQPFIDIIDGDFKYHLDRYKYASRYDENAKRGDVDLEHRQSAVTCLEVWENALTQKPYLLGQSPSIADIATFPFIRQFAATESDWWSDGPLPNTKKWLSKWLESELFKLIMVKHPVWSPENQ